MENNLLAQNLELRWLDPSKNSLTTKDSSACAGI